MILQEFAKQYSIDAYELLKMLTLNQYPIETVNDTIDEVFLEYFMEQTFGLEKPKNKTSKKIKSPSKKDTEKFSVRYSEIKKKQFLKQLKNQA
jgi:hypothetical protein